MQLPASFLRLISLGAVYAVVPLSVRAQDNADTDWNHFGLNFRSGFNIQAKFSEPSSTAVPPGLGGGPAASHQYNDGFVNADSSGNQGGETWNWGYQHASQVSGDNLLMHATGGIAGASEQHEGDPSLGMDFNYIRDFGHYKWGQWGVKIAFGYSQVSVHDNDPMSANVQTITDTYPLHGVVPPVAPYSGSYSGPGPVIGSEPISRSTSVGPGAIITGSHNVDAGLYDLRLGPSVNVPLYQSLSVQGGGGVALGVVDSHFSFTENSAAGPLSASGSDSTVGFVAGAYAEVGFAYRVSQSTSLFTGAQFQYLGDFQQSANGRSARLDFGQSVFYEIGLQWHF